MSRQAGQRRQGHRRSHYAEASYVHPVRNTTVWVIQGTVLSPTKERSEGCTQPVRLLVDQAEDNQGNGQDAYDADA